MLHRIADSSDLYLYTWWQLYCSSFPEDERRSYDDFIAILDTDDRFHCFAILQKDSFAGLITLWKLNGFYYCEHFAITPDYRGGGLGGEVLQYILNREFTPLLCEVEPPENEVAERRIRFYRKYGFMFHNIPYLQPPYDKEKSALNMNLMTFHFPENMLLQAIRELKQTVYNYFEED